MRWPDLLEATAEVARGDAPLVGIYGGAIRLAGLKEHIIPSLDLHLISDSETELWEPVVLQWSQYCLTFDDLILSERRLRALFVSDLALTIGGLTVFAEFSDGVALDAPTRDTVYARAIRITVELLREGLLR